MYRALFFLLVLFISGAVVWFKAASDCPIVIREVSSTLNPQISEKVLICGVCRNIEKAVPNTLQSIQDLGSRFSEYRAIVYENNSTDQTKKLLRNWADKDPHVIFLSEQLSRRRLSQQLRMNVPFRTAKIARARNIVLDVAMKKDFDDFKYVVWADLDFLEPWDVDAIVETILHPEQEWDAVLANGAYDLFSIRTPEFPIGWELIGDLFWEHLDQIRELFVFDAKSPWKKVYSAFGGIGVYKRDAIRGCRYSGVATKDLEKVVTHWLYLARQKKDILFLKEYDALLSNGTDDVGVYLPRGKVLWSTHTKEVTLPWVCEHIPFHASMALHGRDRIFINPKIRCNP